MFNVLSKHSVKDECPYFSNVTLPKNVLIFSYLNNEIWNMKFLRMQILQFFNTTRNLLTKFHMEIFFSTFWYGMKLKLLLEIPFAKWIWWVKSSIWSYDFVSKWFLVRKLHSMYVPKVMVSSIIIFCQELTLVQISTYTTSGSWDFMNWITWLCLEKVFGRKLYIKHMTKVMVSFITFLCQGLSLIKVSTSNHTRKLRFQEGMRFPSPLTNNVCKKSSTH